MIKNNNPGNIRHVKTQSWQGEILPGSSPFVVFDSLQNGYRALMLLLKNYMGAGYNTIEKIITRWAPPSENNTAGYIQFVAGYTNIPAGKALDPSPGILQLLAAAISEMEHAGTLAQSDLNALQAAAANFTASTTGTQTAGANMAMIVFAALFLGGMILKKIGR